MKLFHQQNDALQYAHGKPDFACFMEMRTGKSLVAIRQCQRWGGKVLLVAPLSTWYDWLHLLKKEGISAIFLLGSTKQKRIILCDNYEEADWIVINPEGLTAWGKEFFALAQNTFPICVLDESVFIKNPKAKITKLLLKYRRYFEHHMIMTGTPIAESTEDIVTQMIWCHGEFMGMTNFYQWRPYFMKPARFGWILKRGIKERLREELKQTSFVCSAKDAGMFVDQTERVYLIDMPNWLRSNYDHIAKHWAMGTASTKFGVVKDIWLAQLACGIYPKELTKQTICPFKVNAVEDLLTGELRDQQVVIFSRWVKEVYAISNSLRCACITGNTEFSDRERLLRQFRQGEFPYLVVQTKCACRGLDLSCVNTAIMCSNYWQHEIRAQILARMLHPHKQIPTLFIDIISRDTIEENVYELLQEKHLNSRYFLQRLKARVKKCRT